MQRIAVLTSGGDAPGMNAAIRSVTRYAISLGWDVLGVRRGYAGLIEGAFEPLTARAVGGIIQQGGTVLGTARSVEFMTEAGRLSALESLRQEGVGALIVIGGNGSLAGALALARLAFPVVGIGATIDNDLIGSDVAIGVDTALNIALEAIDRLKVTAASHHRAFLVEVMGRNCGYLALVAGITGGAEVVVIPEIDTTPEQVAAAFRAAHERGKAHSIAVVAEGARYNADALLAYFDEHQARIGFELRATTLGHVQRGGAPTASDRLLASRLGAGAVAALDRGETGVVVGVIREEVTTTSLADAIQARKPIDPTLFELARILEQ